jgi:parallel beta-helix repeat protein
MRKFVIQPAALALVVVSFYGCDEHSPTGPDQLSVGLSKAASTQSIVSCGETISTNAVLTEDLTDCSNGIIIGADDVVLDGRGHTISGLGSGYGITLNNRSGVTIKNLTISGFSIGISVYQSTGNRLIRNILHDNDRGVRLAEAMGNEISRNSFESNHLAVRLLFASNNNEISRNVLMRGQSNSINLQHSSGNEIVGNELIDNGFSIDLFESDSNTVARNHVSGTKVGYGIRLIASSENTLSGNRSESNQGGGYQVSQGSNSNEVRNNRAAANGSHGFEVLAPAGGNFLTGNASTSNAGYGFRDDTSGGTGELGTDNWYARNRCNADESGSSSPVGLCR